MASPTQWTWVWASSGSWWRTGKADVLQSMVSQSRTWLSDWMTRIPLFIYLILLFSVLPVFIPLSTLVLKIPFKIQIWCSLFCSGKPSVASVICNVKYKLRLGNTWIFHSLSTHPASGLDLSDFTSHFPSTELWFGSQVNSHFFFYCLPLHIFSLLFWIFFPKDQTFLLYFGRSYLPKFSG